MSVLKAKVCKSCGMCTCSGQSSWVRGISLSLGSSQSRARGAPGVMARGIPDAISVRLALGPGGAGWRWAAHMGAGRRLRLRSMGGGGARAYHFLRAWRSSVTSLLRLALRRAAPVPPPSSPSAAPPPAPAAPPAGRPLSSSPSAPLLPGRSAPPCSGRFRLPLVAGSPSAAPPSVAPSPRRCLSLAPPTGSRTSR